MSMEVIRRDDAEFEITFTDKDGTAINLTGGTVFFTVKKKLTDTDADAVISKEVSSFNAPTTGIMTLSLTDTETNITPRAYYYDVQFKDSSGTISSSERGRFYVTQDVTIRTV
jgi:hypothetical protein